MKKYLPKGRFSRNIAFLASGTIASQLIAFAAIPVLTRLYSPGDFGILATYASLLGIISVIANLRYQLAIPLANTEKEASALLVLSIIVTSAISILVLIAVLMTGDQLNNWLNNEKIDQYIWLLPIGVFFIGLYQAFNYWAIREKDLKIVAKTKIIQAMTMVGTQIIFFKFSSLALIFGHAIGQSAGVSRLAFPVIKSKDSLLSKVSLPEIIAIAKRYKKFPLYSSWAGLLNSVGNLAPNLLFAVLFSPAAAGLFFLANRIVMTPMSLLGNAIGQSFYTEAAESRKKGSIAKLTRRVSKKLLLVIALPALVVFFIGEEVTTFILGNEWRDSGAMIEWLSLMMAAQFITSPISNVFSITEQQLKGMTLQFNLAVLRVGSIFLAYSQGANIIETAMYFSIASSIGYLIYFIFAVTNDG